MKTVLLHEYKFGKTIADNLQTLISSKYTQISDEEYNRVQNAINQYLSVNNSSKILGSSISTKEIEELRNEISSLKQNSYDVEEEGLFFVDEEGNIAVEITSSGLYAINLTNTENGVQITPITLLSNLEDVIITNPQEGDSLSYVNNSWKNSSTNNSIGNLSIIDY